MNLIFSADKHWGIGRDNQLLLRTKGDMAHFRNATTGKTVVMGRKTLESLPGGNPLPNRRNIVLTRDKGFAAAGILVCHSLQELFAALGETGDDDIMVIGGEQVYRQLMPYARSAIVTRWDTEAPADAFMANLDTEQGWELAEQSPKHTEGALCYRFCLYLHRHPKTWRDQPQR